MLFVVCCLLSDVVCCSLFAACLLRSRLLVDGCWLLLVVYGLVFAVCCLL